VVVVDSSFVALRSNEIKLRFGQAGELESGGVGKADDTKGLSERCKLKIIVRS